MNYWCASTLTINLCKLFFPKRRGAEPLIISETFPAVLRAYPLTFGEAAEAVGTLHGFPLRGGRWGLRYDILRIPALKKISAFSAEHKPRHLCLLCAFCALTRQRQQLCFSVSSPFAEPLRLCDSALKNHAQTGGYDKWKKLFFRRRCDFPWIAP